MCAYQWVNGVSTLTWNGSTGWQSVGVCIVVPVCQPHCEHTSDTKVNATNFVAGDTIIESLYDIV
jgi:hypothetical protein